MTDALRGMLPSGYGKKICVVIGTGLADCAEVNAVDTVTAANTRMSRDIVL